MDISNLDIFRLSDQRMRWLNDRQRVISENIANADTPRYKARDLRPFAEELKRSGPAPLALNGTSEGMSLSGTIVPRPFAAPITPTVETAPNGNSVVIEEQMAKAADVRSAYELSTSIYRKQVGLLKTALGQQH